jgi:hypothetical protein
MLGLSSRPSLYDQSGTANQSRSCDIKTYVFRLVLFRIRANFFKPILVANLWGYNVGLTHTPNMEARWGVDVFIHDYSLSSVYCLRPFVPTYIMSHFFFGGRQTDTAPKEITTLLKNIKFHPPRGRGRVVANRWLEARQSINFCLDS